MSPSIPDPANRRPPYAAGNPAPAAASNGPPRPIMPPRRRPTPSPLSVTVPACPSSQGSAAADPGPSRSSPTVRISPARPSPNTCACSNTRRSSAASAPAAIASFSSTPNRSISSATISIASLSSGTTPSRDSNPSSKTSPAGYFESEHASSIASASLRNSGTSGSFRPSFCACFHNGALVVWSPNVVYTAS